MNPELLKYMNTSEKATFSAFISDYITQETTLKACSANENKKRHFEGGSSHARVPPQNRPSYRPPAPRYAPPTRKPQYSNPRYKKATVTAYQEGKTAQTS